MDFAFFAIAFNIKKMCSKIAKRTKNGGVRPILVCLYADVCRLRIECFGGILKNRSPEIYQNLDTQKSETVPLNLNATCAESCV